jgi:PIN domain nuclease of toxin-antitoxin system
LLDTHAYLWWLADSPRLSDAARRAIADSSSLVHVSAASIWEIAIKQELGRLQTISADLVAEIEANQFLELPIRGTHAARAAQLPPHHRDPFDRVLVAQAQIENLTLVSSDRAMLAYGVPTLR